LKRGDLTREKVALWSRGRIRMGQGTFYDGEKVWTATYSPPAPKKIQNKIARKAFKIEDDAEFDELARWNSQNA
jgi:hypothetical protein